MELTNTNDEKFFDPTLKLKSSPIPILFIPFNKNEYKCNYCRNEFSETFLKQKYCKNCFLEYIKNTFYTYLDVCINTCNNDCILQLGGKRPNYYTKNIQEWCKYCSEVLYFKQIVPNKSSFYCYDKYNTNVVEREKNCKLCKKLFFSSCGPLFMQFKSRSCCCYQIFSGWIDSGWIESSLIKKSIPILYLPWWDTCDRCVVCRSQLEFISDCQKWCPRCFAIYTGCRYCLTTNIIFGIIEQSQCKKCERISFITIDTKNIIENYHVLTKINSSNHNQIANYMNNIDKISNQFEIYDFINRINYCFLPKPDWISYSQIGNYLENNENSLPIMFIPFNNDKNMCHYCKRIYFITYSYGQKYCKNCLFWYIKFTTNNNVNIFITNTKNSTQCTNHESRNHYHRQSIQEWCKNCSEILYFEQIITYNKKKKYIKYNNSINSISSISFEWTESTFIKKSIPILYLPWWDARDLCIVCDQLLEFKSDCQKWCQHCFTIYTGCRYCLTTNIIFGIIEQSQCKKCERISFITIDTKNIIENFHVLAKINSSNHNQIANYMNNIDENSNQLEIYDFINRINYCFFPKPDWISYSQIENYLENNENSLPIMFIPFNNDKNMCHYCKRIYFITYSYGQKYCKYCLFWYIKFTTNNNVNIFTTNTKNSTQCTNHEPRNPYFHRQSIQEWCKNCSEILYFEQIITYNKKKKCIKYNNSINSIASISFEWTESTFIKKSIPILYLPWWDTCNKCIVCKSQLEFKSDCQKWCPRCLVIYTGCRYCLTTNIIFGIIEQSQCKKCERISFITIDTKNIIENFLVLTKINSSNHNQIANYISNIDENSNQLEIYDFINGLNYCFLPKSPKPPKPDWISYSQISLPIMFVPFNNNEDTCHYCKRIYSITYLYGQKYCKHCLFWYIKFITNSNVNTSINIINAKCTNHKPRKLNFHTQNMQNIQEWCKNCSEISYFEQIITYEYIKYNNSISSISFEWTESTFIKKSIPILYLPWWDTCNKCIVCKSQLEFKSDCQKWCPRCLIIYTGCRYCLTTNIIFGIIEQSQCKKCERISFITIDTKNIIENFHVLTKMNSSNHNQIANYMNNIDKNSKQLEIYDFISELDYYFLPKPDWISYSQIENYLENNENSLPIMFIPFNNNENMCHYCKKIYSITHSYKQKYCEHCLFWYIKFKTNNDVNVFINTKNIQCTDHEPRSLDFHRRSILEWCKNCSEISYFEQIVTYKYEYIKYNNSIFSISFEWTESTFIKKSMIPILYLLWWDARDRCIVCKSQLEFKSDCQKWCSNCFIIYTGCRYCLTTNIIFGIIEQSQCKKCERISFITIDTENIIENFHVLTKMNSSNHNQIANYISNIDENSKQLEIYKIYDFISGLNYCFPPKPDWISYSQIENYLENNENSLPIMFIPFNNNENMCHYCKKIYSITHSYKQKYCEHCLFWYIKFKTNNNVNVFINTKNAQCTNHEPRNLNVCRQSIQEWCKNCSEISYFEQIVTYKYEYIKYNNSISSISFEWTESTFIKKSIPILYLSWWDARDRCIVCKSRLEFKSDCQKWCSNCFIIYTGCRYCLTTNVIFGITKQSQCKKCERILFINIDVTNISCRDNDVYEFLISTRVNINNYYEISNYINNITPHLLNLVDFYEFIKDKLKLTTSFVQKVQWIPYCEIKDFVKIAEGGYGTVYKASWLNKFVAVKRFSNSQNIKYFLNELTSLCLCYDELNWVIRNYGITQDPMTKEFMLIMYYANGGNLHNYLQNNFINITWEIKLDILWKISSGLSTIHEKNFIHRDFHSGNILLSEKLSYQSWYIGDLGLSQPANNDTLNNEIYGVIPYIAPEIFSGAKFSKESDIYSLGMIMWELTAGCKPFANVDHNIDLIYKIINGKQPEITDDTPECFANLIKRCLNPDPTKRPSIIEVKDTLFDWHCKNECVDQFEQAEKNRLELIQLKLIPKFSESHPGAIYTSRALNSSISKFSTTNSSSIISFDIKVKQDNKTSIIKELNEEYISKEYEYDINTQSSSSQTTTAQNFQSPNAIYTSRPLSEQISIVNSKKS